ncbi:hypothetical protein Ancab_016319 [Ancistrocladus abbreviatus]
MGGSDSDSSGGRSSVRWGRWLRRMLGWVPKSTEEVVLTGEQLRNIFMQHDKDGDGRLNREELEAAFRQLGSRAPAWRAERAIYYNDLDLDEVINEHEMDHLIPYTLGCRYTLN